jgi:hypothetical protein
MAPPRRVPLRRYRRHDLADRIAEFLFVRDECHACMPGDVAWRVVALRRRCARAAVRQQRLSAGRAEVRARLPWR